jgi:acetyl esterase/lipase
MDDQAIICDPKLVSSFIDAVDSACQQPQRGGIRNRINAHFILYATPEQRNNPQASPLLASSLAGLPPTMLVTCQFDPLRDEGNAYARALMQAGVQVEHVEARGHIHTSITMVDMLPSGAPHRREMARALRGFFS